tara:strand:- start:519 stop:902 length:384 start_codon:yes stop_codon:yes gene_type:complete
MLNKIFKQTILTLAVVILCFFFNSCAKEKETIGIVIVKDVNGNAVKNAFVTLHQDDLPNSPSGQEVLDEIRRENLKTDSNGRVEVIYELEAILNVDVWKPSGNDTLRGTDIIRLLKAKTVTKVVEIN